MCEIMFSVKLIDMKLLQINERRRGEFGKYGLKELRKYHVLEKDIVLTRLFINMKGFTRISFAHSATKR